MVGTNLCLNSITSGLYYTAPGSVPIAASRTRAFTNNPLVATAKTADSIAVMYLDGGGTWHQVVSATLPNPGTQVNVGNSIAISSPPAQVIVGTTYYERIFVAGTDGNIYETTFKLSGGVYSLTGWTKISAPNSSNPIDYASDSLAATNYTNMGTNYQTLYVRTNNSGTYNGYATDLDNSETVQGWSRQYGATGPRS